MDRLHDGPSFPTWGTAGKAQPNVVFGPMQWGPGREVARKAYDELGLHGKVSPATELRIRL